MVEGAFSIPGGGPIPAEVRTVFFDAGNTLVYLDLAWIAERLASDGWDIDEDRLFYGQSVAAYEATHMALLKRYHTDAHRLPPYFSRVLELAGIPKDFTRDCANILVEEHRSSVLWRVVPDFVQHTLSELLRRGYMLGVISNTDGRLKPLLDKHGLSSYFTCIIDSSVVGIEKPSTGIFRFALDAAEADPQNCVYVGDIFAIDIAGARRAGMTGILIDPLSLHGEFDCIKVANLPAILNLLPPVEYRPIRPLS